MFNKRKANSALESNKTYKVSRNGNGSANGTANHSRVNGPIVTNRGIFLYF